ncbi:MAG: ATP-dependent RecD-like DNA helicase [Bacilli bacterium]|nr:ATP-dependent RecD-like DNA helicase [Bacilli bacterium]
MNEYVKGNIKKIIYRNDNGYTVGVFKVKDASSKYEHFIDVSISFTGYFHELNESDTYNFYGGIVNHPKYGEQFNVELYDIVMPEEKDSITEFLSSGTFKGIGEKTAEKIVNFLGDDALRIIIESPSNLLLIPGITKKQIDVLHNTLVQYESSYNTILKLNEMGFVTRDSMVVYNKYKGNTINVLEENLYRLIEDIKDITFKKIDAIALKQNYERTDKRRVKASIIYTMEELCNALGHSYLSIDEVYKYTIMFLGNNLKEEDFIESLNSLILELKVIKEEEKYFLRSMWEAEDTIIKRVIYLSNKKDNAIKDIDKYIKEIEYDNDIVYNSEQLLAIKSSVEKNFLIITGGPGTGKTTIVSSILDLYKKANKLTYEKLIEEVVLLAPTGRASKRLTEKTLLPASTIHSFLKWNKDLDKFAVNEYNKSDAKLVIIDEASMVDVPLFHSLLKGLRLDTKIIMVGDYNQLPSVGPGQLLKDLIESNVLNVISLKMLYRQGEDSNIITIAHDINNGVVEDDVFLDGSDLKFVKAENNIINEIGKIGKKYNDYDYRNFQILVPMYKGINGIDNLNKYLQDIFNPASKNKKELVVGDVIYREHDKILQLVNMPEERIFNGDIGIISKIDKKEILVDFDTNQVKFTPSNFNKFKHGYAISIHKSQGSEFDVVVLPVVPGYTKMLYRKLYYTAVTRSKKKLIIVGDINSLKYASSNNSQDVRKTTIKDKIVKKISIS